MASRFYLRQLSPSVAVSAGEKSTALPVGTFSGPLGADLALRTAKGTAQVNLQSTQVNQTAHQDNWIRRWVTEPLSAQTIAANNWTLAVSTQQDFALMNSFTICSIYVYRPSTNTVVGYIYDSDTPLGSEWSATPTGQVLTVAGAQVIALADDLLVLELWRHAAYDSAPAEPPFLYMSVQYDGATDVTAGATTNAAAYLETPQSILLAGGGGATIAGTIAANVTPFTIAMTGSATAGRVGTIVAAFPVFSVSATGTATAAVVGTGRTFNVGYAYTRAQLEAAVEANSSYNTCPLNHASDPTPAHKEPVIDPLPGDAADTGSTREIVHTQYPSEDWYTTSLMPPGR